MLVAQVITRLKAQVPDLRTVDGAAQFAQLMASNQLPQLTPAAHVVPSGMQGGQVTASGAGHFVQSFQDGIGVILTFRNADPTGARAFERADDLIREVMRAIAGWSPVPGSPAFQLLRGSVANFSAGTLVYQIDFSINDQLRVIA
jgi:hypothetical protein